MIKFFLLSLLIFNNIFAVSIKNELLQGELKVEFQYRFVQEWEGPIWEDTWPINERHSIAPNKHIFLPSIFRHKLGTVGDVSLLYKLTEILIYYGTEHAPLKYKFSFSLDHVQDDQFCMYDENSYKKTEHNNDNDVDIIIREISKTTFYITRKEIDNSQASKLYFKKPEPTCSEKCYTFCCVPDSGGSCVIS